MQRKAARTPRRRIPAALVWRWCAWTRSRPSQRGRGRQPHCGGAARTGPVAGPGRIASAWTPCGITHRARLLPVPPVRGRHPARRRGTCVRVGAVIRAVRQNARPDGLAEFEESMRVLRYASHGQAGQTRCSRLPAHCQAVRETAADRCPAGRPRGGLARPLPGSGTPQGSRSSVIPFGPPGSARHTSHRSRATWPSVRRERTLRRGPAASWPSWPTAPRTGPGTSGCAN